MKPTQCSPSHRGLSNGTKSAARGTLTWEIPTWQSNKTNKQPSFMGNYVKCSNLNVLGSSFDKSVDGTLGFTKLSMKSKLRIKTNKNVGTKLVTAPKLVLTGASPPVLDLSYLCLPCFMEWSLVKTKSCKPWELIPSFIKMISSFTHSNWGPRRAYSLPEYFHQWTLLKPILGRV